MDSRVHLGLRVTDLAHSVVHLPVRHQCHLAKWWAQLPTQLLPYHRLRVQWRMDSQMHLGLGHQRATKLVHSVYLLVRQWWHLSQWRYQLSSQALPQYQLQHLP